MPSSISRICSRCSGLQRAEDDDLVDAVHELGRELAPRGIHRSAIDLLIELRINRVRFRSEPHRAVDKFVHLAGAEVRRHNDQALREVYTAVIAKRERCLVEDAEQQLPQRVAGFFDLVKQQDRELQLLRVPLVERFLREQRMGLAMSKISGRRADQFCDLVRMLEFSAVDFDERLGVAEERFGNGFNDARLARPGRTQEKKITRSTRRATTRPTPPCSAPLRGT